MTRLQREKAIQITDSIIKQLSELKQYDLIRLVYSNAYEGGLLEMAFNSAKNAHKRAKTADKDERIMYYNMDTEITNNKNYSLWDLYSLKLMGESLVNPKMAKEILTKI